MEVGVRAAVRGANSGGSGFSGGSSLVFREACFCAQASKMQALDPPRNASKELWWHCGPLGGLWEALEELWGDLGEVLESFGRVWGSSGRALAPGACGGRLRAAAREIDSPAPPAPAACPAQE